MLTMLFQIVGATVVLSARRADRLADIVEKCNAAAKEHKSAVRIYECM